MSSIKAVWIGLDQREFATTLGWTQCVVRRTMRFWRRLCRWRARANNQLPGKMGLFARGRRWPRDQLKLTELTSAANWSLWPLIVDRLMRNFSPSEHTFESGMGDETVLLHLERGMRKQAPDGLCHARANCLPITRLQRAASLGCFASPALEGLKHVALGTRSSARRSGGPQRTHACQSGRLHAGLRSAPPCLCNSLKF